MPCRLNSIADKRYELIRTIGVLPIQNMYKITRIFTTLFITDHSSIFDLYTHFTTAVKVQWSTPGWLVSTHKTSHELTPPKYTAQWPKSLEFNNVLWNLIHQWPCFDFVCNIVLLKLTQIQGKMSRLKRKQWNWIYWVFKMKCSFIILCSWNSWYNTDEKASTADINRECNV